MTAPDVLRERANKRAAKLAAADAGAGSGSVVEAGTSSPAASHPAPPPTLADGPLPFTRKQLRDAIPEHCFERSLATSTFYLLRDFAMLAALGVAIHTVSCMHDLPLALRGLAWGLYWWLAGWVGTGVWVIAHECGHQAFSDSETVNNSVGWLLHSALLVPFHSWRITHAQHHAATNSMEDDAIFVPPLRSEKPGVAAPGPVETAFELSGMILFGWPSYLFTNVSGPAKHRGTRNDHFTPWAHMFAPSQWWDVAVSDIGILAMLALLTAAAARFGLLTVLAYYGVPYLIVHADLVIITFLQHTDVFVPHFRKGAYSWLQGAISTVDRKFGFGADWAWHHITDTHVAHHLFHDMPWYHAQEATLALRKALGPYYMRDETPAPLALWRAWSRCRFVEDAGNVVFYKRSLSD